MPTDSSTATPLSSLDTKPFSSDPTAGFFGAFLVVHVVVWTILATVTQPNLPDETLHLLTSGQSPAWGYYDSPPLAIWLMSFVSAIFAPAAWPAYFVAQLCIATCLWSAWQLGRKFLHPWTAICGAVALEGCHFFTWGSTSFTSAHLAGACWAVAILALYRGFQLERRSDWLIVGIALALGMLSHYSTALLIVAMITFSLMNHQARQCWDTSWPFLAAVIFGVILLPHVWWAWSHGFSTVSTAMQDWASITSHGQFTLKFVISEVLGIVPVVILLIPIIAWFRLDEPTTSEDEERDFVRQFLLFTTVLPAALMLALALIVGVNLGSSGLTLWTFAGVLLLLWSELDEQRIHWRTVILRSGAVGGGFAALLIIVNFMMPYVVNSSEPSDIHFPGRQLAYQVRELWEQKGYQDRRPVIAGPRRLAQNASWYHGTVQRPLSYNNLDHSDSAGVNDETLRRHGGIILWTDDDLQPAHEQTDSEESSQYHVQQLMTRRFYDANSNNLEFLPEPIELVWGKSKSAQPLRVYAAIVHPVSVDAGRRETPQLGELSVSEHQTELDSAATGDSNNSPVSWQTETAEGTPPEDLVFPLSQQTRSGTGSLTQQSAGMPSQPAVTRSAVRPTSDMPSPASPPAASPFPPLQLNVDDLVLPPPADVQPRTGP